MGYNFFAEINKMKYNVPVSFLYFASEFWVYGISKKGILYEINIFGWFIVFGVVSSIRINFM